MGIARPARGRFIPQLEKRKPDYESLNKLASVRINLYSAGIRPAPAAAGDLLHARPAETARGHWQPFATWNIAPRKSRSCEALVPEAQKIVQVLKSTKTNTPRRRLCLHRILADGDADVHRSGIAQSARRCPSCAITCKSGGRCAWRLPMNELDALGVPRGPEIRQDHGAAFRHAVARQGQAARRARQDFPPACGNQGRAEEKARKREEEARERRVSASRPLRRRLRSKRQRKGSHRNQALRL